MAKAQTLHSQAEQLAWGTQVQALLDDALPMHLYPHKFEMALIRADTKGLGEAWAILLALLEDANQGYLRHHDGKPFRD
jgi:hypothetical protein